jgi:hypothetical protein
MEALCKGTLFQLLSAFPSLCNVKEDCLFKPTTIESIPLNPHIDQVILQYIEETTGVTQHNPNPAPSLTRYPCFPALKPSN